REVGKNFEGVLEVGRGCRAHIQAVRVLPDCATFMIDRRRGKCARGGLLPEATSRGRGTRPLRHIGRKLIGEANSDGRLAKPERGYQAIRYLRIDWHLH